MIKEDFVSLEIAELLDKCHFNEPCRAKYAIFGDKKPVFAEVKNFVFECYTNQELKNHFTENEKYYAAPTLQLAVKWLKEIHGLAMEISFYVEDDKYVYQYNILNKEKFFSIHSEEKFENREEAIEKGMKYALENLSDLSNHVCDMTKDGLCISDNSLSCFECKYHYLKN